MIAIECVGYLACASVLAASWAIASIPAFTGHAAPAASNRRCG